MPFLKFKVGDIVAIRPTISRFVPGGVVEVVSGQKQHHVTYGHRGPLSPQMRNVPPDPDLRRSQIYFSE
jgi:hypothetical protein